MKYNKPIFEKVANFKKDTNGVWFGKFTDIFGGRAVFQIVINY